MLSPDKRKNEKIYINRIVFSNTGNYKDDEIMERYLCKFINPSKFETLADIEFELIEV